MALLQISEPGQSTAPHQHRLAAGIDLGTTNSLVASVRSGTADTLPDALVHFGGSVALVHNDLGTSDAAYNAELALLLAGSLAGLMTSGGIVVSNQAFSVDTWARLHNPPGVKPERYFLYRAP